MKRTHHDPGMNSCGIGHGCGVRATTALLAPFVVLLCFALLTPGCDDPAWGADVDADVTTQLHHLEARIVDLETRLVEAEQANAVQGKVIGLVVKEIYELSYTTEMLAEEVGMLSGPATVADELWPGIDVSTLIEVVKYDPIINNYCPIWTAPLGDEGDDD